MYLLGIVNSESSSSSFRRLYTSRRITDWAPIETPIDIGRRDCHCLACQLNEKRIEREEAIDLSLGIVHPEELPYSSEEVELP